MGFGTKHIKENIARLQTIKELLEGANFGDADYDAAFYELQRWVEYTTSPSLIESALKRLDLIYEKDRDAWAELGPKSKSKFKSRLVSVLLTSLRQEEAELEAEELDEQSEAVERRKREERILEVNPIFHGRHFSIDNKLCFVLMPFTEPWSNRIWEQIKSVVAKSGFTVKRADDMFGHNVMEDIWTAINRSHVIIADVTNKNPNVFYELGIAHTLGKRVVLLTQSDTFIPFDLKPYRYILYEDNADGYRALEIGLQSTLGEIVVLNDAS